MNLTKQQIDKLQIYFGITKSLKQDIKYFTSINPEEEFHVDEFIDWQLIKQELNLN